jgi:putative lipoprotein
MGTKRFTAGALALTAIVVAGQLLTRERPPSRERPVETPPPALAVPTDEAQGSRALAPPPAPVTRAQRAPAERAAEPAEGDVVGATLAESDAPRAAADGSRRFMFDCGNGVTFAVRVVPGEATLFSPRALGAEVIRLPQVDSARYAEGGVSFLRRGGLATFELRERTFADCTSNPGAAQTAEALRRGATFRAHGNEPNWLLEITHESIELATEGDTRHLEFPYRVPTVAGTRTTYRSFVGTQELVVVIDTIPCNDTVSGERFESTATVTFEGATLYGCGRAP